MDERGLIAVTGAGGFLGLAVTRALSAAGAGLRLLIGPPGTPAPAVPEGAEAIYGWMEDEATATALVEDASVVVHLAGPASASASYRRPAEFARSHVVGTAAMLHSLVGGACARVVHISSAEIYGRPRSNPVAEDHPAAPLSPYGVVKCAAENLARTLAGPIGVELVILRPFSVYGFRSPATSLVGRLLRQALTAEALEVADLLPVRDYVHVDDVAAAVVAACTTAVVPGRPAVYNIAGGVGYSVRDVAELIVAGAGRPLSVRQVSDLVDRPPATDLLELVADVTRARRDLGWQPRIDLTAGLRQALVSLAEDPAGV